MQYKKVLSAESMEWIKDGWEVFKKEPGILIVMTLIFIGASIVAAFIPFVGTLAITLLSPAIGGGFMYVARELDQGRNIEIGDLFQAFKQEGMLNQFLIMGAIYLGISILTYAIVFGFVFGGIMSASASHGDPSPMFIIMIFLGLFFGFTMFLFTIMLLFYGIPLVMLDDMKPVEAMKSSFMAFLKNIWPLTIFSAILLIPFVIALIPFGLGFIVLFPILTMMQYTSYRSVYH